MGISRSLEPTLFDLEHSAMIASKERLDQLLAEDFKEFGSSGKIYNRQQVLETAPTSDVAEFTVGNFELRELCPDVVLVTYRLTKALTTKSRVSSLRGSVWKMSGDRWRMVLVFNQGHHPTMVLPSRIMVE